MQEKNRPAQQLLRRPILCLQQDAFFYFSASAARNFSGNLPLISRSIERIIDEMARADEPPWPIITGALIPITGVPPIDS